MTDGRNIQALLTVTVFANDILAPMLLGKHLWGMWEAVREGLVKGTQAPLRIHNYVDPASHSGKAVTQNKEIKEI